MLTTENNAKLVILGRGKVKNTGRKLIATRIRTDLLDRLSVVASGPSYLVFELAIEAFLEQLETANDVQFVRAGQS